MGSSPIRPTTRLGFLGKASLAVRPRAHGRVVVFDHIKRVKCLVIDSEGLSASTLRLEESLYRGANFKVENFF